MKKGIVKLLSMGLVLSMTAVFAGCSNSGDEDVFRVGMECGYAPFNWTQKDNSNGAAEIQGQKDSFANGYDVQIAKKIADGLGKKLVIVKTAWAGLPSAVQAGKVDAIIAGMSPTEDRKMTVDFSDAYYKSDLIMIVKAGSPYENATKLSDFSGAKITGQLSTFHYDVIDQIEGVDKQTAMDDFAAMRVALEAGKIDGYVAERPEGISVSAANKNFKAVEFEEGQGFQASDDEVSVAVGLKKGNEELKTKINEILSGISEEERNKLMEDAVKNQPASANE